MTAFVSAKGDTKQNKVTKCEKWRRSWKKNLNYLKKPWTFKTRQSRALRRLEKKKRKGKLK